MKKMIGCEKLILESLIVGLTSVIKSTMTNIVWTQMVTSAREMKVTVDDLIGCRSVPHPCKGPPLIFSFVMGCVHARFASTFEPTRQSLYKLM